MSEIEAFKLIIKFEDVAAMSTPLGPESIPAWSRDFGAFLVQNSAIAIVVHNDEEEQSEIWFGDVLASTSCTSMEGVRQAVELGVAELGEPENNTSGPARPHGCSAEEHLRAEDQQA